MGELLYGKVKKRLRGAVYEYHCEGEGRMAGGSVVYCDGKRWNGTKPGCLSKLIMIMTMIQKIVMIRITIMIMKPPRPIRHSLLPYVH